MTEALDLVVAELSDLVAAASVADVYIKFGAPPSAAADQSTVLLAAIEGALILARARRSTELLDTVERYFATQPPRPARRRT